MKKVVIAVLLVLCASLPAMAATNITLPPTSIFTQSDFKDLSRDLGLVISYIPLATAEPLGGALPHVDAGVEVSAFDLDTNSSYWQKIKTYPGNADIPSTLPEYPSRSPITYTGRSTHYPH
jgi:hypothetical protein